MDLDLDALETSFDLVAPRGDQLMDTFYAQLFATTPAVRPLFAGTDLGRQKSMLLGALVLGPRPLTSSPASCSTAPPQPSSRTRRNGSTA
jgi:hemoglobin-like flavoprotein